MFLTCLILFLNIKLINTLVFILIFLMLGFSFNSFFAFNRTIDFLEKICLSIFFSFIYLSQVGIILNYFNLLKKTTLIFSMVLPLLFFILTNRPFILINLKKNFRKKYLFIFVVCLFSGFIHVYPSLQSDYPVGFDTYRLHTTRINYILKNGRKILGDLITHDSLDLFSYKWGFHLILGSFGLISEFDTLILLRVLPFILAFIFPLATYTASPFLGIKDKKTRYIISIISCFILSSSTIHGLVYPFPSSLGLILFTISLRFIYESYNNKKILLFNILLFIIFFQIYMGLALIYLLIILICIPNIFKNHIKYENNKILQSKYFIIIYSLFVTYFFAIGINTMLNPILSETDEPEKIISYASTIPQIYKIYEVTSKIQTFFFCISLLYLSYLYIRKDEEILLSKKINVLLSLTIISSTLFYPWRWVFYAIPFVIILNGFIIHKIISKINYNIKLQNIYITKNSIIYIVMIILFVILGLEPYFQTFKYNCSFNINFTENEIIIYNEICTYENNSIFQTPYRINRLMKAYSISKNILYLEGNKIIYFFENNENDLLLNTNGDLNKIYLVENIGTEYIIKKINNVKK